jgi:hypothetical protein
LCLVLLEVLEEFRHPSVVIETGSPLELDFFFPQLRVAVEYQVSQKVSFKLKVPKGSQHYANNLVFHRLANQEEARQRDLKKIESCKKNGTT